MDVHVTLKGRAISRRVSIGSCSMLFSMVAFVRVSDCRRRVSGAPPRGVAQYGGPCVRATRRGGCPAQPRRLRDLREHRAGRQPSGAARACGSRRARPIVVEGHSRTGASSLYQALYDFRVGGPDEEMFPFTTWRRLMARELRLAALAWGQYGESSGHAGLRAAIARHIGIPVRSGKCG